MSDPHDDSPTCLGWDHIHHDDLLTVGTEASQKGKCPKKEVDFVYTTVYKKNGDEGYWKFQPGVKGGWCDASFAGAGKAGDEVCTPCGVGGTTVAPKHQCQDEFDKNAVCQKLKGLHSRSKLCAPALRDLWDKCPCMKKATYFGFGGKGFADRNHLQHFCSTYVKGGTTTKAPATTTTPHKKCERTDLKPVEGGEWKCAGSVCRYGTCSTFDEQIIKTLLQ